MPYKILMEDGRFCGISNISRDIHPIGFDEPSHGKKKNFYRFIARAIRGLVDSARTMLNPIRVRIET